MAKKKAEKKVELKDIKRVGNIPAGYDENDALYFKEGKIYVAKKG